MYPIKLPAADYAKFLTGLFAPHSIRIELLLMDMAGNVLTDLSDHRILNGQVNVDGAAEVSRSASLELFDPARTLSFDTNSPADGALFLDRMMRINYQVKSPDHLNEWVSIPIFTGPITGLNRTDATVSVELLGKEKLAQTAAWRTKNYAIGSYRRSIIQDLMINIGETKLALAEWSLRTADPFGTTRETDVWQLARRMAAGRQMMLYYDGAGTLVLRPWLSRAVFTFDKNTSVLSDPQISYNVDDVKNIVLVKGGIPKGASKPVEYVAQAQASHPLSPQSLGRNGKPRYLALVIEDTSLLTVAACKERATAELNSALLAAVNTTFESMPVPFLDFGDVVTLKTDTSLSFTLDQFSIPLVVGEKQSNGYNVRRGTNKVKIRQKKK